MPTLQGVKTMSASVKWTSPDKQRVLHDIVLDYHGKQFKAATWSDAIATVGWSGDIETYEKEGKYGSETFVKQPQKEGFSRGAGTKYPPKDEKAIQAMWAIGQAVQLVVPRMADGIDTLSEVYTIAQELNSMVDAVKSPGAGTPAPAQEETPTAEELDSLANEPLPLDDLDAIFPSAKETPWKNS